MAFGKFFNSQSIQFYQIAMLTCSQRRIFLSNKYAVCNKKRTVAMNCKLQWSLVIVYDKKTHKNLFKIDINCRNFNRFKKPKEGVCVNNPKHNGSTLVFKN